MAGIPISACVICKNQVGRIFLTLDSLAWCDEIVVIDSGSTDGTVELCQNHPCGKTRVIHQDWLGYNPQRRFAADQCRNPWVLMLDADEECSGELQKEIQSLNASRLDRTAIFEMPRRNYVALRQVRCWGPDFQSRLIHKDRLEWGEASLPEVRHAKPGFEKSRLAGPLLHNRLTPYSPHDFCDGRRMEDYAGSLAQAMHRRGKKSRYLSLAIRPAATFIKYYLLRGGFLQGRFGLAIAYKTTISVMLKYSVLYGKELEEENK